jgi:hypothetical protein
MKPPWRTSATFEGVDADDETRRHLLELLDDAHSFGELERGLRARVDAAPCNLLHGALRFLETSDVDGLEPELQERFAQVLSRFVESRRALELAGKLEADDTAERS